MLGRLSRHSIAALAVIALTAGMPPSLAAQQPAMISTAPRQVANVKRIRSGARYSAAGGYGRKGAGVSMAAQQRAARKQRNVARNRRSKR